MDGGDVVATFMAISGCNEEEAIDYLANANFDLALAQTLYESDHNHNVDRLAQTEATSMLSPASPTAPYLVDRLDGGVGSISESFTTGQQQQHQQQPAEIDMTSELFMPPQFVYSETTSFTEFCHAALGKDQWVLLSFLGDDFVSLCVNRDVWKCEGVLETLNMFSIYQVSGSTEVAEFLAHGYRIDLSRDLPTLLIINPLTTKKESRVPLNMNHVTMDVDGINENLLSFVAEHGSPSQREEKRALSSVSDRPLATPTTIVDDTDDTVAFTALQSEMQTAPLLVEVVDISQYEVPSGERHAFALRCRLPKGQLTLRLKPETPAHVLLEYLAYRAYVDDPESYPHGVPKCSLKAGYPPRSVSIEDRKVHLATWGRVSSGDTVFLHIE